NAVAWRTLPIDFDRSRIDEVLRIDAGSHYRLNALDQRQVLDAFLALNAAAYPRQAKPLRNHSHRELLPFSRPFDQSFARRARHRRPVPQWPRRGQVTWHGGAAGTRSYSLAITIFTDTPPLSTVRAGRQINAVVSGKPNMTLKFCTAAPDAPL